MKYLVNVSVSGGDNKARVLKWGITASSTNSSAVAVARAADKLCAKLGHDPEAATVKKVAASLNAEVWQIEVDP